MKTPEFRNSENIFEKKIFSIVGLFIFFLALPQLVSAHCDFYDGPVIKDALKALKEKKVGLVLKWVEPKYEKEITAIYVYKSPAEQRKIKIILPFMCICTKLTLFHFITKKSISANI